MKKLIVLLSIIAFAFMMQAQTERLDNERENILIYSDTTALNGGDVLTRLLYGFLPMDRGNGNYVYEFRLHYVLNSEIIRAVPMVYNANVNDSIFLLGSWRTFDWVYPQVLTIDEQNWHLASWQTFLQKIINN